jgi:hypothetical protein
LAKQNAKVLASSEVESYLDRALKLVDSAPKSQQRTAIRSKLDEERQKIIHEKKQLLSENEQLLKKKKVLKQTVAVAMMRKNQKSTTTFLKDQM